MIDLNSDATFFETHGVTIVAVGCVLVAVALVLPRVIQAVQMLAAVLP